MREIKFRGRDDEGQWHFGFLSWYSDVLACICDGADYEVDPETVGQYTGLRDADGREIYEGDVIKLDDEVYAVTWDNYSGCWSVEFGGMGLALLTQYSTKDSTIIGNVHDNPSLMEGTR